MIDGVMQCERIGELFLLLFLSEIHVLRCINFDAILAMEKKTTPFFFFSKN